MNTLCSASKTDSIYEVWIQFEKLVRLLWFGYVIGDTYFDKYCMEWKISGPKRNQHAFDIETIYSSTLH